MGTTNIFGFDSTQTQKALALTQLMTHNGFPRIGSNQLMAQKAFQNFDSNRLPTQKRSGILIRINSWLNYTVDSIAHLPLDFTSYDLFVLSTQLSLLGVTFFGLPTQVSSRQLIGINSWLKQYFGELNRFNSWLKWLSRELTQNQLWTQADPHYWFRSTHDSSGFPENWLRINSWLKQIPRYWLKSIHDSSKKQQQLILSRLRIRLWVVPMSVQNIPSACPHDCWPSPQ